MSKKLVPSRQVESAVCSVCGGHTFEFGIARALGDTSRLLYFPPGKTWRWQTLKIGTRRCLTCGALLMYIPEKVE